MCRDRVGRAKAELGLDLEKHVKDKKNSFCIKKGLSSSRQALEKCRPAP